MGQKKAHEVAAWLTGPHPDIRIVLVYGPDRGLVSESARRFAVNTGLALDDPFAVLKLDATDLAGDAGRLIDEARTISMFGGSRLIWLRNATNDKHLSDAISTLCDEPPQDALILVEAGELKKGSLLRKTVEQAPPAMALPCYADNARAIENLIDEELSKAGLTIGLEARRLLRSSIGGDRLASRQEIEKLVLYCRGTGMIEPDDVLSSTGDVSAQSQDAVVDAVLSGDRGGYDLAFTRFIATGASPFLALSSTMRQLQALQLMREKLDGGKANSASIVASARPPVFFGRRQIMEKALSRWNGELIARALVRIQDAVLKTRRNSEMASAICRQTLLALCLESARLNR